MTEAQQIDRPHLDFFDQGSPTSALKKPKTLPLPEIPAHDADSAELLRCVAQAYRISVTELVSKDRHKNIAEARMVAYWLLRTRTKMSLNEIGVAMRKDHTSVMSGMKNVVRRRACDPSFCRFTDRLAEAAEARIGAM